MFGLKIIVTIIIVLIVMAGYLMTNPIVSSFLGSVGGGFSSAFTFFDKKSETEFSLAIKAVPNINFSAEGAQLRVDGESSGTLGTSALSSNQTLRIVNFTGRGFLGDELRLDGSYDSASLPGVSFSGGRAALRSSYRSVDIENLKLRTLQMTGNGTLIVKGVQTQFSDITIEHFVGSMTAGDEMRVEGVASSIEIPSAKIKIG